MNINQITEKYKLPRLGDPDYWWDKDKFIPANLANAIMKIRYFKTMKDTKEVYYYEDGIYKRNGETVIDELSGIILHKFSKSYNINETIKHIRRRTYADRSMFNSETKIVLENGVLDLVTLKIENHNPFYLYTHKIPVFYNPKAQCPNFDKFLDDIIDVEWKKKVLQEWFGYHLLNDRRFQKALMIYGETLTGKSTLLRILTKFLGEDNYSSASLQHIATNAFAPAYLYDKMANICPELSTEAVKNEDMFMRLVGNDPITSAKKGGHEFTFNPIVKLSFSCNEIPRTYNKNPAFYRRWILVEFNKPIKEIDIKYGTDKSPLTTRQELSGILNWAIEGLKRLLSEGKFSYPFTDIENKDLWERHSDPISSFVNRFIDITFTDGQTKSLVYEAYVKYCKMIKVSAVSIVAFGREFKKHTNFKDITIKGTPVYGGIELNPEGQSLLM